MCCFRKLFQPDHMEGHERNTYLSTEESVKDVSEEIERDLRLEEPLSKSIIGYLQINPVVASEPEAFPSIYEKITNALLENPEELRELILAALDPDKVSVVSSKQAFLSAAILKNCPRLILHLLEKGSEASVLFEFLTELKNETSLGYFKSIFDHDEAFQNQVIRFFAGSASFLEICFQNCHYEDVFLVLVNSILLSNDSLLDFKKELFNRIVAKMIKVGKPNELFENIMEMMDMILENLLFMRDNILQMVADSIPSDLIDSVVAAIVDHHEAKPWMAEYQIRTLSSIVGIYKTITQKKIPIDSTNLQVAVIRIISNFDKLLKILQIPVKSSIAFSNGQSVTSIGLVRYYVFFLFRDILTLQHKTLIPHLHFTESNIKVIEVYLCKNKWNNLMHKIVEECVMLLLKYERVSPGERKYVRCKEFLNFLLKEFKSSEYMFMGTNKTSSYGNVYFLYNIARAVAVELQDTSELHNVMQKYKPLQKFITDDLQKFEIKMDAALSDKPSFMVKSKPDTIKKLVRKMTKKEPLEQSSSRKVFVEDEVGDYIKRLKRNDQDKH